MGASLGYSGPMSTEGLDALRARVNDDPDLARRLRRADSARFAGEVTAVAGELGCEVTEGDVEQAMMRGRQAWTMRWIR
jgi:hypothetical protein